jgi:hypothetical protein
MLYFLDKGVQGKKMGLGVLGEGNKLFHRGVWTLVEGLGTWEGKILPSVFGLLSKIGLSSQNMADRFIGESHFLTVKLCCGYGPKYAMLLRR